MGSLSSQVQQSQRIIAASSTPLPETAPAEPHQPVHEPRGRTHLLSSVVNCSDFFEPVPSSESDKVAAVITQLTGRAWEWAEAERARQPAGLLSDRSTRGREGEPTVKHCAI